MPYIGKKPADIIATAVDTTTGTFSGDLTVDTNTLYVDSTNNNVGIGTTSPTAFANYTTVAINGTNGSIIDLQHGGTINSRVVGESPGLLLDGVGSRYIKFHTNSTERMRIDSSGNLLVGATSYNSDNNGFGMSSVGGVLYATTTAGRTVIFNRRSSDGEIINLRKDGSTVGSITTISGGVSLGSGDTGLFFEPVSNEIRPFNTTTNASIDNAINLGNSTKRFKDLYLSGKLTNNGTGGINIDTSGNVGIGTTNPLSRLHINNTSSAFYMGYGGNQDIYFQTTNGNIIFSDYNAANERMRIDSSGNLLVGKTSTSSNVAGHRLNPRGDIEATRSGGLVAYLNRQSTDGDIAVFAKDGTTVGKIVNRGSTVSSFVGYPDATNGAGISASTNMVIATNGTGDAVDNTINLGSTGTRWKDLHLSGGIYLGGSVSANYLDDYEEGTWTPAVGGTATYTSQFGIYTKVGNVVTCQFRIHINNLGTGSTTTLSGFPFADASDAQVQSGHCSFYANIAVNTIYLSFYIENNATTALFVGKSSSGSTADNAVALFGNSANVYGQITYRTA